MPLVKKSFRFRIQLFHEASKCTYVIVDVVTFMRYIYNIKCEIHHVNMVGRKAHIEKTGQLLGISISAVSAFSSGILHGQRGDVRVLGVHILRQIFQGNSRRAL